MWSGEMEEKGYWEMIASLAKSFEHWSKWEIQLEELRAIIGIEEDKKNLQMEINSIHKN